MTLKSKPSISEMSNKKLESLGIQNVGSKSQLQSIQTSHLKDVHSINK